MVTLTEDTKKEFREFRETLEELGLDEECYHKIVEGGENILAQLANGMEQTVAVMEGHYPHFGGLLKSVASTSISQYDYMFRLLENYMDPELDQDEYSFKRDRQELLLALRYDFFKN